MLHLASTRIELARTVLHESVPFPTARHTILCVDGRQIRAFTSDQNGSSTHGAWVHELKASGQGAIHWPGGVYGLVLIPLLEVVRAHSQPLTSEQIVQLTQGVLQVFTDRGMPFIWHDDEHTAATSKGARETHAIGCAAVKAAMEGNISALRIGDREAAKDAYVAASEHPEGVRATYTGEHHEQAFIVNLSTTYTIGGSPDTRGNQWFLIDLDAGVSLLRQLAPELASAIDKQLGIHLDDALITRELAQDAVRFGLGTSAYLARTLRLPLYMLPERHHFLGVRRLRHVQPLYQRGGVTNVGSDSL